MRALVCVVSWNTAEHLPASLDAWAAQTHDDREVVVVDNASADPSAHVVRAHGTARLVANGVNLGYAGAANQAAALAAEVGADALVLANPDAYPEPGYLAAALAALEADPRRASVQGRLWRLARGQAHSPPGARVLDTTGHLAFTTRLFRNRGEGEADLGRYAAGEVFGTSGALACYRLAALDDVAVGGEVFDADLFAFFEDVDVDWRLRLRGWSAWYEPAATGWHERGGAGARRSAVVERLNFANRPLVVLKNDDLGALSRALPGVAATTALKTGELAATVPSALLAALGSARLVPRMLVKRRIVQGSATVAPAAVAARWFAPFDYRTWVQTWWARVRAEAGDAHP